MLLAVSIFLVQQYPQEQYNQSSYLIQPLDTAQLGGSILDVRRGGDLKFSGLRQLLLAVICSLKSAFSRFQQDSL